LQHPAEPRTLHPKLHDHPVREVHATAREPRRSRYHLDALAAAEIDGDGYIDGVAVAEPAVELPANLARPRAC
jgi:hypothetical protein